MKKRGLLVLSIFILCLFALSVSADFQFYGYTYNTTKGPINGTNVTIDIYSLVGGGPPSVVKSFSNLTNESGWFNLTVTTNASWDGYKPVIRHFSGSDADYVGQSLPDFEEGEMSSLGQINFYLKEGATINITAINATGSPVAFEYMIKDTKLGYPIEEQFNTYTTEAVVYLPADRNYSIMLYPNESFPVGYNLNNISDYSSPKHVDIIFNTSETFKRVSGYAKLNGTANFSDLKIITFLMEPGNMLALDHPFPYNLSDLNGNRSSYNFTTGFYNITLPASAMELDLVLFANANKNSDYYGAFRNITVPFNGTTDVSDFNFTLQPLLGSQANIEVENFGASGPNSRINITTKKKDFQLKMSNGSDLTGFAFIETLVNYSSLYTDGPSFSWMQDVGGSDGGLLQLILLNHSIEQMNIFSPDSAPQKKTYTVSELQSSININVSSFDPGAIDSSENFDIYIDMLQSNAQCDVPNPNASACSLFDSGSEKNKSDFSPLTAVMGGGAISFRMRNPANNITIHYKNVDMLASGPPDVLFDGNSNPSQSGSSLEEAWRFGSNGPEIYDEVLIGVPFNENFSVSTVDAYLGNLYDENWNVVWNSSNTTANLPSEYSDFNTTLFNHTDGMGCSSTDTNLTGLCYIDSTHRMLWLKIPHFSGVGPEVSGTVTVRNVTINKSSDATNYSINSIVQYTINITNTGNVNITNVDLNDTYSSSYLTYNASNVANTSAGTGWLYWSNLTSGTPITPNGSSALYLNMTLTAYATNINNTIAATFTDANSNTFSASLSSPVTVNAIDNVTPIVSNVSVSSVTSSGATVTVNASDNLSGIATCYTGGSVGTHTLSLSSGTTYSASITGLSASTNYTVNVTCNDSAGNSASSNNTANFTTSASSGGSNNNGGSSSSGSGSGSRVVAGEIATFVESYVPIGNNRTFEIENGEIGFSKIRFVARNKLFNVVMKVKKTESQDINNPFNGTVYKYVEIEEWNLDEEDIENSQITFPVSRNWLSQNNINQADIVLFRYVNNEWVELETSVSEEGTEYVYFTATTPGFSYFAIGTAAEPEPAAEETEQQAEETVEVTPTQEPEEKEQLIESGTGTSWIVFVVVALIAVGIIAYFVMTKKKK